MKQIATELKVEQGTEEWLEARLGKATASRFNDVFTFIKNPKLAGGRNYLAELVSERLTGQMFERFRSAAMEYGSETEELARVEYMLKYEVDVKEAGIFLHNELMAGASPDGLVGDDGTIEIKCKQLANHLQSLHTQDVPNEHIAQIQGALWLTGRAWCDFISFAPELPSNAQMFAKRVNRDDGYIQHLIGSVGLFLKEVASEVEFVKNYNTAKEPKSEPANTAKH